MKKNLLLIVMIFCISSVAISQSNITTGDYLKQHPELVNYKSANASTPAPVITKDSGKQLLAGETYTYVGFYYPGGGPEWWDNPPCYTGQEAAALLFGGMPEDYAISTNSNTTDPGTITFTALMCSWGEGWSEYPQDYKLDVPPPGYTEPYEPGAASSAYVRDWTVSSNNYVWRVNKPVPLTDWALGIGALLIVAATVIRFSRF